ncbi:hypothetical protein Pla175_46770 [Pirellulimonas nuda]|uniref:DUF1207 domain-containing protein n=1 Tax=Pirellulimonas nuda TaxID=2528009 RepID=A0A518DIF0_9BACT|nr:DUF1207 domain-containing protein [Pirellulimonas nuda]QDU91257.1 hypothetical protein Pla175_46770 [Pirellulimonas nuda]
MHTLTIRLVCLALFAAGAQGLAQGREPLRDPFIDSGYDLLSTPPQAEGVEPVQYLDGYVSEDDPSYDLGYCCDCEPWSWHILPDGVIYKSYWAGPREPRMALQAISNRTASGTEGLWDATLGGRRAILRYGNNNPLNPEGWEVDIEGAAIVRLNLDENRDLDSSDFRFGVPLTYGKGPWAVKFGYYHLSSHLGDERILRNGVNDRDNYVRDSIIFGLSYHVTPALRVYGETAFTFFNAGLADPWEFQFGAEYARAGVTGPWGTPFAATNAHLHEEIGFSGGWTFQTGWLWRGDSGSVMRLGLHYHNGPSSQYQFITTSEEQVGFGIWYDY